MNRQKAFITTLGLSLMMLIAACTLVASASAQTGGAANQIIVWSQETNTGQIMVDTVIAAQDGWLVVYSDTTFSPASMIGWVPVHKGVNTNLKVNIDSDVVESTPVLWAALHADRGVIGQLELPLIDGTVQENGRTVMVAFGTQALPVTAATPKAQAPAAAASALAGVPQTLPAAGASLPPIAWFVLAVLGGMALAAGVFLSRMQVRK